MKSGTKRGGRMSTRICAVIGAGMIMVMGLPACTSASMSAPRSAEHEPARVQQTNAAEPELVMTPLVLGDETSKSLPVEQDEEPAEACSDALYVEEPLASGYVKVSEGFWQHCEEDLAKCGKACRRKRSGKAKSECFQECNKAFTRCLQVAGLVKATFDAFDAAWSWIKGHKAEIVGTIVIVGGVAYLVSTGGSGALVLIPLGA